jgi:hypothetical protein
MCLTRVLAVVLLCSRPLCALPADESVKAREADTQTRPLSTERQAKAPQKTAPEEVLIRGRVVCLAEEMHRLHGIELPGNHLHLYGFRRLDGHFYTLLQTRSSEALFVDARMRDRELVLKGRLFDKSCILEVSRFFGVREGWLEEISYYCGICVIHSPSPGPCPCCQEDLELQIEPTKVAAPEADLGDARDRTPHK